MHLYDERGYMDKINQTKISIIVPVHNTGIYLEEALESIFVQSFQDFEVICVDDASSDRLTRAILQKYQSLHESMRVIWLRENVGAGEARNIGFAEAKGEYVMFLDADDIFAEELLEKMYRCICINQADVCICGHEEFYMKDGERCVGVKWMPEKDKLDMSNREDWLLNISTAAWDKLCRVQFLREKGIYFQSLPSCNDVFFSCRVMINAARRCCIEGAALIFYRTKSGNQISANRNPLDLYKAMLLLNRVEQKINKNELLQRWIGAILLRNGIWELENCRNENLKKQYYELLKEFFAKCPVSFHNKVLEVCVERLKSKVFDYKWLSNGINFLDQLRLAAEKLKLEIKSEKRVFLWGLGYRGDVFEQFCKEQGIALDGVADIKNVHVGETTVYGNRIVETEYVLKNDGLIIASNEAIYHYLYQLYKKRYKLLNLEEYYLF